MAVDPGMVIGFLRPLSRSAHMALELPHNRNRVISITPALETQDLRKRQRRSVNSETTAPQLGQETLAPQLVLSLLDEHKPTDPLRGFVFGNDKDRCDVLLDGRSEGVSRVHFRLSLNWESGALLITDTSSLGTNLTSSIGRLPSVPLLQRKIPIFSGDTIQAGTAMFKLIIPDRGNNRWIFDQNRLNYYNKWKNQAPQIETLLISQKTLTYLDPGRISTFEVLGSGTYGTVHKAVDAVGNIYAVKFPKTLSDPAENSKVMERFERETKVLHDLDHEHIVSIIKDMDISGYQDAFLVMEYISNGTLEQLEDLTPQDIMLLASQVLDAVLYLHTNGYAHRDIKPANILVKSVEPFSFVLSDFGLTSRDPLQTFCGSNMYAAPEIYNHQPYTAMVDIWAIGTVILKYTAGLPALPTPWDNDQWFKSLSAFTPKIEPCWKTLRDFANTLLEPDPDKRPIAQVCLTEINKIRRGEATSVSFRDRKRNMPSTPAPYVPKDITADDLKSWVQYDQSKDPPRAINLTRICWALCLSRDAMRSYLKKEGHASYVMPTTPRKKLLRGTYVSISCALAFLRSSRPDLKNLIADLQQLDSSSEMPETPEPPISIASDNTFTPLSRPRALGESAHQRSGRSSTRALRESVRQGRERSSPQALDDAAIQFIDPSLIHQGAASVEQDDLNNLPEFVINSTFDDQLFFDSYIAPPQE
ncbi:carbon catabolite-derepressing protein kinase [Histoplasma capsulatum G186AR]|uniref:Serine/threonine-protein kinase ATG1 n=2 Tax=Ajellomyces capsulatus TaxID=5037 RepID=C0NRL1_AJECG|nr:carbon catabolite-derepressing protein kinase [Histoplasma capsulatum G186AR]EEH06325.1 carbon catabolite-derepressing protein kinase [Histoplasma capsulatum G186AR]KAG5293219.1 carbon catabolite-derepressing protein kinase [Histoplasma capsulatum]QSS74669.1 carbon catabolite-derepressing protein kinase [Histoplasma capsulatum G186AR]